MIQQLNVPIHKVEAKHDTNSNKTRPSDCCELLPSVLYLAQNCNIMLLRNIFTAWGLVNGSTGKIIDFVYHEDDSNLPRYLIIDFPTYSRPAVFSLPHQRTWFPLPSTTYRWGGENNHCHFRESFPIALGYALTAWKCQGMGYIGGQGT